MPASTLPPAASAHRIHREFRLPVRLCALTGRRRLWWAALALGMILARIALLPVVPIPAPKIHDEFSYLLAADTFAHGRLANPAPAHPEFFESPHVLVQPTYASKYPPGQGLVLALGQKLFGDPYWGVVLSGALMIFLFCWAADAWLPPQWALIAGALAWLLFLPHYWFNTYWGGSVAACGGALVVGGLGYFLRGRLPLARFSLGGGAAILLLTRPYEGGVLCLVTLIILAIRYGQLSGEQKSYVSRKLLPPNAALLAAAVLFTGWCNWRITGRATELPYTIYMHQRDVVPTFWMLPPLPPKPAGNVVARGLQEWEIENYGRVRDLPVVKEIALQLIYFSLSGIGQQFLGSTLLLLAVPWARLRIPKKWLVLLFFAGVAALFPETWVQSHYTAPYTVVELILIAAVGRALWYRIAAARFRGPLACGLLIMVLGTVIIQDSRMLIKEPAIRPQFIAQIEKQGGRQLVFVAYEPGWDFNAEWVYNGADPADEPIIFAHDLGEAKDRLLVDQYKDRKAWLLRLGPGASDLQLKPYQAPSD